MLSTMVKIRVVCVCDQVKYSRIEQNKNNNKTQTERKM